MANLTDTTIFGDLTVTRNLNNIKIIPPVSEATLTIAKPLTVGADTTYTGGVTITSNGTSATVIRGPNNGTAVLTAGTMAITGGKLSQFSATTSAELAGVISDETGTGKLVFATTPTLTTPVLGVATATSINKVTITAPATSATLTIANGKTLTVNNTITLSANADSKTLNIGDGGTLGTGAFTSAYSHPSDGGGSLTGLSGATVISGITVNTLGHVTGTTTRSITIANLGALSNSGTSSQTGAFGSIKLKNTATTTTFLTIQNTDNTTTARTLSIKTNNADRTIELSGNLTLANSFTTSGNYALTLTATGATNVTLPTSGILINSSDSRLTDSRTPKSHTHGDVTNTGFLGSAGNQLLITSNASGSVGKITTLATSTGDNGKVLKVSAGAPVWSTEYSFSHPGSATTMTALTGANVISQLTFASGHVSAIATRAISLTDLGIGNVENTKLSTWTGSSNITTVGTVAGSGKWQASTIGVGYGGTGLTSATDTAIITGGGTGNFKIPGPKLTATAFTFGGAGEIKSTTTSAITIDSGSTGAVNIGTNNNAKTINIGTGTGTKTIVLGNTDTSTTIKLAKLNSAGFVKTDENGVLSVGSLPTASASDLGGIKIGDGLAINNGVLSTSSFRVKKLEEIVAVNKTAFNVGAFLPSDTFEVYLNGLRIPETEYSLSSPNVVLSEQAMVGDSMVIVKNENSVLEVSVPNSTSESVANTVVERNANRVFKTDGIQFNFDSTAGFVIKYNNTDNSLDIEYVGT